jgi:hypothetical protein
VRTDEFIKAADGYNRRAMAVVLAPVFIALLCILVCSPFQKRYDAYLQGRFGAPIPDILELLPVAIPLLIAVAVMIPLSRRNDRALGVGCPHCRKPLAQFKSIVIASKNCPYCGKLVLDEKP